MVGSLPRALLFHFFSTFLNAQDVNEGEIAHPVKGVDLDHVDDLDLVRLTVQNLNHLCPSGERIHHELSDCVFKFPWKGRSELAGGLFLDQVSIRSPCGVSFSLALESLLWAAFSLKGIL